MAFVTTLHLQASADAELSCKPVRPVTRGGHDMFHVLETVLPDVIYFSFCCTRIRIPSSIYRLTLLWLFTSCRPKTDHTPRTTSILAGFCSLRLSLFWKIKAVIKSYHLISVGGYKRNHCASWGQFQFKIFQIGSTHGEHIIKPINAGWWGGVTVRFRIFQKFSQIFIKMFTSAKYKFLKISEFR